MKTYTSRTAFLLILTGIMLVSQFGRVSSSSMTGPTSQSQGGELTKVPTSVPNSIFSAPASSCDANGHCTVSSVGDWIATNIMVQAGYSYQVSYVTGTWTVDVNKYYFVGPEGYDTSTDTAIGYWEYCKYDIALPYGTLLGKVGTSGSPLAIGRGGTFTSQDSGVLYLRINDQNQCHVDNDGYVTVDVSAIQTPPSTIPEWTLLYYFAADSNTETDSSFTDEYRDVILDALQHKGNANVNLAIFYDGYTSKARYQYFRANGESQVIWKDELNTGDPANLSNFVLWAKHEFPAHHYALVINDHGHALSGVAWDSHPIEDHLEPKELKAALTASGKVDVLFIHACLMANLEIEYELRGLADYYVAHESLGFAPMLHSPYLRAINAQTTPEQLALSMASTYYSFIQAEKLPSTVSVVHLAEVENVAEKANDLAYYLRQHSIDTGLVIWYVITHQAQRFDDNQDGVADGADPLTDLEHLAILFEAISDTNISSAASDLDSALDDYILYQRHVNGEYDGHTMNYDNSYGVSIALPTVNFLFYNYYWLEFAGNSSC